VTDIVSDRYSKQAVTSTSTYKTTTFTGLIISSASNAMFFYVFFCTLCDVPPLVPVSSARLASCKTREREREGEGERERERGRGRGGGGGERERDSEKQSLSFEARDDHDAVFFVLAETTNSLPPCTHCVYGTGLTRANHPPLIFVFIIINIINFFLRCVD
jgi:hypothetical protein